MATELSSMASRFARDAFLTGLGQLIDNRTGTPINPYLTDDMVRRYDTGSAAISDYIDAVSDLAASEAPNPYGAHRYPRLGLMRKRKPPPSGGALDWDWYDL